MKKIVNNWYIISVYLAGFTALAAAFLTNDPMQKVLLASATMLLLHFYEEFGVPGGFPLMGVRIMLGKDEPDKTKWDCNNLNCMFGNWLALVMIYLLPLILPGVKFLFLSALFLSCAELVMHLILFNVKQKSLYNPGLITGVLGLAPVAIHYIIKYLDTSVYVWHDYVLAFIYFAVVFWFCYRSPLYWNLGRKEGYTLTDQSAYGLMKQYNSVKL